jgi:dTDP-4-dehydrorhamnose 3,5-epimerase
MILLEGTKQIQTATPDGKLVLDLIEGVKLRNAPTIVEYDSEVCEIYNPAWGLTDLPVVYVYQSLVRPGRIKSWVYHKIQTDRLFLLSGHMRFVLYDRRPDSPSFGRVNDITLTERNRALLVIPPGIVHATQNVGTGDAIFINLPSEPYNHADPDRYNIPLDTQEIPFRFERR